MENIKEEIEDKIIDLIALGAGSRLVVFKPENSDKDLIVEKRGDYKKKPISLKIYDKNFLPQKQDSAPDNNFYLVFVRFDVVKHEIEEPVFVVPSAKFSDKIDFSKFLINKKNFPRFLIEALEKK